MNPYKILNVPTDSTPEEIKKVYRKLSMIHHPDKGGNEDDFHKINLAYRVLSDNDKRRVYDEQEVILDESPDHVKNQVHGRLAVLFNEWLDRSLKGEDLVLKDWMDEQLTDNKKKLLATNKQLEDAISKAEAVRERLHHRKDGESFLHDIIKSRVKSYRQVVFQQEQELVIIEEVQEALSEYDYDEPLREDIRTDDFMHYFTSGFNKPERF